MVTNSKSVENLQKALSMELSAVHQYLLHAHVLDDWGLDRLAVKMREEMQEEMGHAGGFIDRILFLKGSPNASEEKPAKMADSLKAMFESDLQDERSAISFYSQAAAEAGAENDIGTRTLFERITIEEEGHMDWLEQQLGLLDRMGESAYAARYMGVPGEDSA